MIKNNQLRARRFFFYGMPTNQWTVEVFRTWDDGNGCKGEAWRPASKTTFNTKAQAEKYLKSLTKPKVSKSSQLMKQIKKTPLRYSEMQQFLWNLSKEGKCPRGYWCTNLTHFIHHSEVIEKKGKRYHLTTRGIRNIKHPWTLRHWKNDEIKVKTFEVTYRYEFQAETEKEVFSKFLNDIQNNSESVQINELT